jgi:hypothetical protein
MFVIKHFAKLYFRKVCGQQILHDGTIILIISHLIKNGFIFMYSCRLRWENDVAFSPPPPFLPDRVDVLSNSKS